MERLVVQGHSPSPEASKAASENCPTVTVQVVAGEAVPIAERALLSGEASALAQLFAPELHGELVRRFEMIRDAHPTLSATNPAELAAPRVQEFVEWVTQNVRPRSF